MKLKLLSIATFTAVLLAAVSLFAQTNAPNPATSILGTFEQYLTINDTNYNGWTNNSFTLWQAAAFSSVQGTPGESPVGNDLGLEIPRHSWKLAIDSVTRFETVFGDVANQQLGVQYQYPIHQVEISAGLDGRYTFTGKHLNPVPYLEFKKASTSLNGVSPLVRYSFPIRSKPGAGELDLGMSISF